MDGATILSHSTRVRGLKSYVVYRIDTISNTMPSEDYQMIIDIYEDASKSVREIDDIADAIDSGINHKVIDTEKLNMHFERDIRQYVSISIHALV